MNDRHRHAGKQLVGRKRTWIFQANPTRYRILESLQAETEELWNLNQHTREVEVGDRVLIWISGDGAGIYAVGRVVAAPVMSADSPTGQAYWIDTSSGRQVKLRVLVRYERIFTNQPLLKSFIACDPGLWNLAIIRQPRGTNFVVTEPEWQTLREWLEDDSYEG